MEQMMEQNLNMKMNAKLKVLVCSKENNIRTIIKLIDDKTIEQVRDLIYLGNTIRSNRRCKKRNKTNMSS